jgi:lipopolysaccharide transport system ATP-binding protein
MTAIQVENISKLYYLGDRLPNSLRDAIVKVFHMRGSGGKDELWALRDVNFEVAKGETLGIIGRNGAGKSTLLKILSRITKPTKGTAKIHGRVGSLLEVGTGFHKELTGRENIYMNGAILGMKRAEIEQKFDEIVAFSEIEQFLDTPVKHYSSGMYMRLAFSVAAHLEPEVLIVDEVLAVGDIGFQRKCLDKMQDISEHGRTVLFVSHNLQAVSRFCSRVIWLHEGVLREDGDTSTVIDSYLQSETTIGAEKSWTEFDKGCRNDFIRLTNARVVDHGGTTTAMFDVRSPIYLEVKYEVLQPGRVFAPAFHVYDQQGICLFGTNDIDPEWLSRKREPGTYTSRVEISPNIMAEGTFWATVAIFNPLSNEGLLNVRDAISFTTYDPMEGDSARGDYGGVMIGAMRPKLKWETEYRRSN